MRLPAAVIVMAEQLTVIGHADAPENTSRKM